MIEVRVASTSAFDLRTKGEIIIDGTLLGLNDLVLLKNQIFAFDNGIFEVTDDGLKRSGLMRAPIGTKVTVLEGATNKGTQWTSFVTNEKDLTIVGLGPVYFRRSATS